MPEIRFTEAKIEALRTTKEREEFHDPRYPNLILRVTREGRKSFVYRLPRDGDGRRGGRTLGRFPRVSLKEALLLYSTQAARVEAAVPEPDLRARIREIEAEIARLKALSAEVYTFGRLAAEYMERYSKPSKRSWRNDESLLRLYALPAWKERPVEGIRKRDVSLVVEAAAQRAPVRANRLLVLLLGLWTWGMANGLVESNPVSGIERPTRERRRERFLSREEIGLFWRAFDPGSGLTGIDFEPTCGEVLRLLLLTGQRRSEIVALEWSELEPDLAWCNLGRSRTKAARPHRVYLAPLARGIVERRRALTGGKSRYVFESTDPRRRGESLHPVSVTHLFKRIADRLLERGLIAEGAWLHDLRRTAATRMAELGVDRRILSRVLNHADSSITARYDLYQYDAEVKDALTRWSAEMERLTGGRADA